MAYFPINPGGAPAPALRNSIYQDETWGANSGPGMLSPGEAPSPEISSRFTGGIGGGNEGYGALVSPPAYSSYNPISYSDPSASVSNAQNISNSLGTVSKLSALLPGVGSVISGVTGAGSLIMNWWATNKQLKEQRAAREEAKKYTKEMNAEEKRRWEITNEQNERAFEENRKQSLLGYNLASQKQTADISMDKEDLAMKKEQQQWDRWLGIMQNMTQMMSSPQSRSQLAGIYRR